MIADLFIKKTTEVARLIDIYDQLHEEFSLKDINILCYGSVLTVTIESIDYITNDEIMRILSEDDLDWYVKDIVRRR